MLLKRLCIINLVAKVNNTDISDFVLKTKYSTDITELEKKIPDTSDLAKKSNYNTKITELENKLPDISILAKKTALTAVENKVNNHSHDKYIETAEFNKLAAGVFNAKLTQVNLITKTDFGTKLSSLNRNVTQNKQNICLFKMS